MPFFERPKFERAAGGEVRLRLKRGERELLRALRAELEYLLDEEPGRPDLRRLFPPAYGDPEEEAEYRRLARDELVAGRRRALDTVAATVDRDRLSAEEAEAWLTTLNDARLVLGTRLDVQEDVLLSEWNPDDPQARELGVYMYLSWLQEQLIDALSP